MMLNASQQVLRPRLHCPMACLLYKLQFQARHVRSGRSLLRTWLGYNQNSHLHISLLTFLMQMGRHLWSLCPRCSTSAAKLAQSHCWCLPANSHTNWRRFATCSHAVCWPHALYSHMCVKIMLRYSAAIAGRWSSMARCKQATSDPLSMRAGQPSFVVRGTYCKFKQICRHRRLQRFAAVIVVLSLDINVSHRHGPTS